MWQRALIAQVAARRDGECECEVVVLQGVSPNMITPAANERTILQPLNRGLRFIFKEFTMQLNKWSY
jgi:hypothetical protein